MNFQDQNTLYFVWLSLILFIVSIYGWKLYYKRLKLFSVLYFKATSERFRFRTVYRSVLIATSVLLIVISLAGPRNGYKWAEVKSFGTDIIVAVDVSKSMLSKDVSPSRLVRAKRELSDLLSFLRGDRIGLVPFAGEAFLQCPLTSDYSTLSLFLDVLDPSYLPVGGTQIAQAIEMSVETLVKNSPEESKGKSILLITDGEDHGEKVRRAIDFAKKNQVKVFVMGVGTKQGAPIPSPDGGFIKNDLGDVVVSKLKTDQLKLIASETGGIYVNSVPGDQDIRQIYLNGIRNESVGQEGSTTRKKVWNLAYQWPLALALILLIFEAGFSSVVKITLMLFMFNIASQTSYAFSVSSFIDSYKAEKAYKNGDYDEAAKKYQNAEIADPDDYTHSYNKGVSLYKDGKYEAARESFQHSESAAPKEKKPNALYNLGRSFEKLNNAEGAISSYEKALSIDPNMNAARKRLEELRKKKHQQKNSEGDQEKQSKSDQGKKDKKEDGEQKDSENGQSSPQNSNENSKKSSGKKESDPKKGPDGEKKDSQIGQDQDVKSAQSEGGENDEEQAANNEKQGQMSGEELGRAIDKKEAQGVLRNSKDHAVKYLNRPMKGSKRGSGGKDW